MKRLPESGRIVVPVIQTTFRIHAPTDRVFDLARSINLHMASAAGTRERAVDGVKSGLIGLHDEVTWEARHFGVLQRLTSRITQFDRPNHFRDSMVQGAFKRFDHDHYFVAGGDITEMRDVFDFDAPLGPLGWMAEQLVLIRYMKGFLEERNRYIQHVAETEEWRQFLEPAANSR